MMAAKQYEIVLCRREPQQLTLDTVAAHAGLHPALVERFVELGLIEPVEWQGGTLLFDASAVPRLRTIGRLRESLGINVAGVAVIMDLLDRFGALQRANESLNSRL
jgi:chaperone modulatory protein CbpM